jgi:hypothetical protein
VSYEAASRCKHEAARFSDFQFRKVEGRERRLRLGQSEQDWNTCSNPDGQRAYAQQLVVDAWASFAHAQGVAQNAAKDWLAQLQDLNVGLLEDQGFAPLRTLTAGGNYPTVGMAHDTTRASVAARVGHSTAFTILPVRWRRGAAALHSSSSSSRQKRRSAARCGMSSSACQSRRSGRTFIGFPAGRHKAPAPEPLLDYVGFGIIAVVLRVVRWIESDATHSLDAAVAQHHLERGPLQLPET